MNKSLLFGSAISAFSISPSAIANCEQAGTKTIFSCTTAKSSIEVCDAEQNIVLQVLDPAIAVTIPRHLASTTQWDKIGKFYSIAIPDGNTTYRVFWKKVAEDDQESALESGINVEIDRQHVAHRCSGFFTFYLQAIISTHALKKFPSSYNLDHIFHQQTAR